jgi:hypothetical protein
MDAGRGFCVSHGGGKRCQVPNCPKGATVGPLYKLNPVYPIALESAWFGDSTLEPMTNKVISWHLLVSNFALSNRSTCVPLRHGGQLLRGARRWEAVPGGGLHHARALQGGAAQVCAVLLQTNSATRCSMETE